MFIYYDNHGNPDVLSTSESDDIYADKLAKSFKISTENNLYKKCLFIIEACYYGYAANEITMPNFAK